MITKKFLALITRVTIIFIIISACSGQSLSRLTFAMPTADASNITQAASFTPTYPLKLDTSQRYLIDQNNHPVFWSGDAAWSLIVQLSNSDVGYYLDDRKAKGFNVILVNLIEHKFAKNAPANYYGQKPFTGKVFTTPNANYFTHADYVISQAAQRGIVVLLAPLYLGYDCGTEGWCADVKNATTADMQSWGTYVGKRYKSFNNIVWVIGGDTDPIANGVKAKVDAFATALKAADNTHLFTAHNAPESMAVDPWAGSSWLNINNIYTYNPTYLLAKTAFNKSPTMPFYQMESAYENERNTTQQSLRAQVYWTALSGGYGYIFGNGQIWCFSSPNCFVSGDWKTQLNHQGSVSMAYAAQLFNSIPWHTLTPDFNHTVLTAGYGTSGGSDYATAAISSAANIMVVYLPTRRTVTIDMSKFPTAMKARWYDPTNGALSTITGSPFQNSGSAKFTPTSNNSTGDGDWVLQLVPDYPLKTYLPTIEAQ